MVFTGRDGGEGGASAIKAKQGLFDWKRNKNARDDRPGGGGVVCVFVCVRVRARTGAALITRRRRLLLLGTCLMDPRKCKTTHGRIFPAAPTPSQPARRSSLRQQT